MTSLENMPVTHTDTDTHTHTHTHPFTTLPLMEIPLCKAVGRSVWTEQCEVNFQDL